MHVEAGAAQLQLTWTNNSTNEDGFKIERSTGTTGTFVQIGVTGPGVTSYTDSGLADATTYCYRVRAYNAAGDSDYTNVGCGATPQIFALAVVRAGTGDGSVTGSPGITCGTSCSASYPSGTAVILTATPAADSTFNGWSGGGCSGTDPCTVTLTAATTVTATFDVPTFTLTVTKAGTGSGTVTGTPAGLTCGTSCSASYVSGTVLPLTATAAADSIFAGWSGGGCSGIAPCRPTLAADTTITATFLAESTGGGSLVAAILPSSRSVQVGTPATAYATMINAGPGTASSCRPALLTSIPADFVFQTTDQATNQVTGTANTPVTIPAGAAQNFVIALTPTGPIAPTDVQFSFDCADTTPAPIHSGLNTLLFSASAIPIPTSWPWRPRRAATAS